MTVTSLPVLCVLPRNCLPSNSHITTITIIHSSTMTSQNSLNCIIAVVITILFSTLVNASSIQQVGLAMFIIITVENIKVPFQLDQYDYSNEELETYIEREKRQINSGVNDQESTTEEFLVEDPKGWGLAHVLGMRFHLCE